MCEIEKVGQAVPPAKSKPNNEYRRRLPHYHREDRYLFITWRLHGSLPRRYDQITYPNPGRAFVAQDRALHQAAGPRHLADPRIADLVANAILIGETERRFYELTAWAVMPNHVHLLILPKVQPSILMRWLKGSTARAANRILNHTGEPFWQDEFWDHYLRKPQEIDRTIAYIESNPASAALPTDWRWTSATWQAKPPAPPNP